MIRIPLRHVPRRAVRLALLVLLAAVPGCLPLPDVRGTAAPLEAELRIDPERVRGTRVRVPGVDVPSTPDGYDASVTLRWSLDEPVDTIVIAVPGLFGGASSFTPLARRMVAVTPGLQVWALDRRANALEDRRPVALAMAAGDPAPAADAYLGSEGEPPSYRRPDPEHFSFVADWGLEVHLGDLHEVVREARATAPRVVLMGHSLGASFVGVYAAWRSPDGPGNEQVDGLILVDGAPGRTGALDFASGIRLFGIEVLPSLDAVASGRATPWLTLGPGGERFAIRQAASVLGALAPDEDAPEEALGFPISNRAFAGLAHDDGYGVFTAFGASVGEVRDADLDGNLAAVLLAGRSAVRSASVVGVREGATRVEWAPGDGAIERSDLDEVVAAWVDPRADVAEWYMPLRFLLELAALPPNLADHPRFVPMRDVTTPTLAIGASRGLLRNTEAFAGYQEQRLGAPVSVAILPGLTHLDVLMARENPVVPLVKRWSSLLPMP